MVFTLAGICIDLMFASRKDRYSIVFSPESGSNATMLPCLLQEKHSNEKHEDPMVSVPEGTRINVMWRSLNILSPIVFSRDWYSNITAFRRA
jgi:hypothetical protein